MSSSVSTDETAMGQCGRKLKQIARGAVGVAKSVAGVGIASARVIARGRTVCDACDHALPCRGKPGRACTCALCGCWIKHKTPPRLGAVPAGAVICAGGRPKGRFPTATHLPR